VPDAWLPGALWLLILSSPLWPLSFPFMIASQILDVISIGVHVFVLIIVEVREVNVVIHPFFKIKFTWPPILINRDQMTFDRTYSDAKEWAQRPVAILFLTFER
jgi:hypothetical protein